VISTRSESGALLSGTEFAWRWDFTVSLGEGGGTKPGTLSSSGSSCISSPHSAAQVGTDKGQKLRGEQTLGFQRLSHGDTYTLDK
jgi:hypothetical protein